MLIACEQKSCIMISIMDTINYLVVAFFVSTSLMLAYLGFKFLSLKRQPMTHFGMGLLFVCLAFMVWTYIVAAHPTDIETIVAIGAIPFLGSFIMFLLAAMSDITAKYRFPLFVVSGAILVGFVILRFFVYESHPGFTENGYFAFNVNPIVLYFYAMLTAFNFIPAVYVVGRHIKHDLLRIGIELGLTLVAVGLIIMVTNQDEGLQVINGAGIFAGLFVATMATTVYRLDKNSK